MMELIFSQAFVASVFRMTTPILFAALAALVQRKANILCIGNEGIMLFAAFAGVMVSAWTGSLPGGTVRGGPGSLPLCLFCFTVTDGSDVDRAGIKHFWFRGDHLPDVLNHGG